MHVTTPAAANFVDSVIVTDDVLNETDVTVAVVVTTDVKPPKKKRPCQSSKEEVISGCKSTTSSTTLGAIGATWDGLIASTPRRSAISATSRRFRQTLAAAAA